MTRIYRWRLYRWTEIDQFYGWDQVNYTRKVPTFKTLASVESRIQKLAKAPCYGWFRRDPDPNLGQHEVRECEVNRIKFRAVTEIDWSNL